MPSLSSDNSVQIQISTVSDTAGIAKTEGAIKDLGGTTDKTASSIENFTKAFVFGNVIFSLASDAAIKIKEGFSQVFDAAKDWQNQQAQLTAAIKSTGDVSGVSKQNALDYADAIAKSTPISRDAVLAAENMELTFTNLHKNVFPQTTQDIADMATRMDHGLTPSAQQLSDTAIMVGKALNDPTTGLTKLQRVGVTFTDQQKDQIKTMQASGDMVGAQTVILNELSKEFGGSASQAATTFTGKITEVKNSLLDMGANGIAKAQQDFINFEPKLLDAYNNLDKLYQKIFNFLKPSVEALGAAFVKIEPGLKTFIDNFITPLAKAFGTTVGEGLVAAIYLVINATTWLLNNVLTPLITWMNNNKPVVDVLAGAFGALATSMALGAAFDAIKVAAATFELVTAPGIIATLSTITAAWVAAFPIAGILLDIGLVAKAIDEVLATQRLLQTLTAEAAQEGAADRNLIPQLEANAVLAPTERQRESAILNLHNLGVKGYATGTLAAPGGWSAVGEDGPELIKLPPHTQVKNAKNSKNSTEQSGRSLIVNQYITNQVDYSKGIAEIGFKLANAS